MSVAGFLNMDKPAGMTSFQVVSMVRKLSGERRVGHGGTLDPTATGVLPVCLGQATRVVEYLSESRKTYRAEVCLGTTTDTYDASGKVLAAVDPSAVTAEQVEQALLLFRGRIPQVAPIYSAIKHRGTALYRLARAGTEVPRRTREVDIHRTVLLGFHNPMVTLEVECGKGTYIRSLAHDLGQILGCGAHLESLSRLACGPFRLEYAVTPHRLEQACHNDNWQQYLYAPDVVLSHLRAIVVGAQQVRAIADGRPPLLRADGEEGELCRVYSEDGELLGLLRFHLERKLWQPVKVFVKKGRKGLDIWRSLSVV